MVITDSNVEKIIRLLAPIRFGYRIRFLHSLIPAGGLGSLADYPHLIGEIVEILLELTILFLRGLNSAPCFSQRPLAIRKVSLYLPQLLVGFIKLHTCLSLATFQRSYSPLKVLLFLLQFPNLLFQSLNFLAKFIRFTERFPNVLGSVSINDLLPTNPLRTPIAINAHQGKQHQEYKEDKNLGNG